MERRSVRREAWRGLLRLAVGLALVLGATRSAWAQAVKVLEDFEDPAELARLDEPQVGELVAEHATHGQKALKVAPGKGLISSRWDFSGAANYDWLSVDIFNPTEEVRSVLVTIKDSIGQQEGYWGRHNETIALRPGMNEIKLPINNLFRGERGSQPMKDKGPIVAQDIKQASFVPDYGSRNPSVFFIDYVRLEKEVRAAEVAGMVKFDFGPPTQTVFPGFTAVTFDTTYTKERGFGLQHAQSAGVARDDQYPNSLYGDYVALDDNSFRADLPDGQYVVQVVYDDPGYWGGEFRPFHLRQISVGGKVVAEEKYDDQGALARYFHFQDTEPLPGQDIYETYVTYRYQPTTFTVAVTGGQLELAFKADAGMVCKVASLVIYPAGRKAEGEAWLADLAKRLRKEWEGLWVYVAPRNPNAGATLPADVLSKDYVLFVPPDADVNFAYTPKPEELKKELVAACARGEYESLLVGLRPLKDLGAVRVEVSDLVSGAEKIPASAVDVRVVRNLTSRQGEGQFTIAPAVLLPAKEVELKKDLTRAFVLTVHVAEAAKPGEYHGEVKLQMAGGKTETLPVKLTVHPFTLADADFTFGLFWVEPNVGEVYGPTAERYWQVEEQVLRMLRENGFTSFTGSPLPAIKGAKAGKVDLDFAAFDRFWKLALSLGFKRDYQSYGMGVSGLSKDNAQKLSISYEELIRQTFAQLREHSKAMGVPPMTYSLCDEPRTEDQYQQLYAEFAIWQKAAPEVMAGYISLEKQQLDEANNPHRKLFDMLTVPILGGHDQAVMDYARKQNKRVDIYNQGTSRFSFGLYQWREKLAGVGGRWQWIMSISHADPYYDLDGREPDPSCIYFRSDGIAPAVRMLEAREGIDDLRYITTAVEMAKKAEASGSAEAKAAAKQALASIDAAMAKLQVGQRGSRDIDLDAFRAGLAQDMATMSK
jgi:hypothetical protein